MNAKAFKVDNINSTQNAICTQMTFSILTKVVTDFKENLERPIGKIIHDDFTLPELNVLRYIAGTCIHNVASKIKKSIERKIHKTGFNL